MKTRMITLFFSFCCAVSGAQELYRYDFETTNNTPYVFRFGNKGAETTYKPRWCYSHSVEVNPVKGDANMSNTVLKYTSQEARGYGLKVRFLKSVQLSDVKSIQLKMYQPQNVIGKAVHSGYSSAPATQQNICIKLLADFNSINDFRQEDGILMYVSKVPCTEEGAWKTYTFDFNSSDYSSQLTKFANGVLGIAILPTFDANVTLLEESPYECYIDDVVVNPDKSSIEQVEKQNLQLSYNDGVLQLFSLEGSQARVTVTDMQGRILVSTDKLPVGNNQLSIPVQLLQGGYIVTAVGDSFAISQSILVQSFAK